MSDRTITEIHEVDNGSYTEVIVTAKDENDRTYVGTATYRNDSVYEKNEAFKIATEEAKNRG
ncbi:MAG: hypothetical protein MJZ45_01260 [Bacteroidales bacterium]|nr:hypothetical protein [Bacteroidales bacterium]